MRRTGKAGYLVIGVTGYLVIGVGGATVQLLLYSVQSVHEGGFRQSSKEVLRSTGRGHHLIHGESWRSLTTEVRGEGICSRSEYL